MIPPIRRLYKVAPAFVCAAAVFVAALPSVSGAAGSKQLRHVRGTVGYQLAAAAALTPVFGKIDLPDEALAVTQASSVAELALPDSSVVTPRRRYARASGRLQHDRRRTGIEDRRQQRDVALRHQTAGGRPRELRLSNGNLTDRRARNDRLALRHQRRHQSRVRAVRRRQRDGHRRWPNVLASDRSNADSDDGRSRPRHPRPGCAYAIRRCRRPNFGRRRCGKRHPTRTWCRSRGWRRNRAERFCADDIAADPGCPE